MSPFQFDAGILERLACPVCHGGLRVEDTRLVCAKCARAYPIVDGIPVLIAERARGRASGLGDHRLGLT